MIGAMLLLCVVALLAAGCGKNDRSAGSHSSGTTEPQRPATHGAGVPASAVAVIKGWADALRGGHPKQAAAYWAHPSAMVNPDASGQLTVIHIDSERQALLADETLSCGATLQSTTRSGPYVQAAFTLSVRTGPGASKSGCSGPAAVDFLIRGSHIARWLRAPLAGGPPEHDRSPRGAPGSQSI